MRPRRFEVVTKSHVPPSMVLGTEFRNQYPKGPKYPTKGYIWFLIQEPELWYWADKACI